MSFPKAPRFTANNADDVPPVGSYNLPSESHTPAPKFSSASRFRDSHATSFSTPGGSFRLPPVPLHASKELLKRRMSEMAHHLEERDTLIAQLRVSKGKLSTRVTQLEQLLRGLSRKVSSRNETLHSSRKLKSSESSLTRPQDIEAAQAILKELGEADAAETFSEVRLSKGTQELKEELNDMIDNMNADDAKANNTGSILTSTSSQTDFLDAHGQENASCCQQEIDRLAQIMTEKEELEKNVVEIRLEKSSLQEKIEDTEAKFSELHLQVLHYKEECAMKQAEMEKLVVEYDVLKNEARSLIDDKKELTAIVDRMKAEKQELEKELAEACAKESSMVASIENMEATQAKLQDELVCKKEETTDLQSQVDQFVLENNLLKNEAQSLIDSKQELLATVEQMKAYQQELEEKMAQTYEQKFSLEVRTENLETEVSELHRELLRHKQENTDMLTQVEQLLLENDILKREAQSVDDCKQELSALSSTLSHVKLEKEEIEKKVVELHLEKATIENRLETLTANFDKLHYESMQHQEEKTVLMTKLNQVSEMNEALQSKLDEAFCEVAELKSSVAHLHDEISFHEQLKQDMLEQLDSYGDVLTLKTSLEEKLASALVEVDSLQSSNVKFSREIITLEDANRAARNDIAKLLKEKEQLEEIIQSCHEVREEVEVKLSDATHNLGILKEKADFLSCENLRQREVLTNYARQLEDAVLRADRYKCVCSELDRQKRELRDQLKQLSEELTQVKNEQISNLTEQLNSMAADAERWKASFEALQMRVAPFQEQLELYEMEKELLEKRNEATESELSKLYRKVSEMMGHQNHKQKIHYLSNLLEEQHKSRKELHILREKNLKQTKEIAMLQVQLHSQKMKQGQKGTLNQTAKENVLPKPPM